MCSDDAENWFQQNLCEGHNEAILKGIAIDLHKPDIFPAVYNWGQYEDFKSQLQDKVKRTMCIDPMAASSGSDPNESESLTDGSTFKPKSLKNQSRLVKNIKAAATTNTTTPTAIVASQAKNLKRTLVNGSNSLHEDSDHVQNSEKNEFFNVKLKPLGPSLGHWGNSKTRKKATVKASEQ